MQTESKTQTVKSLIIEVPGTRLGNYICSYQSTVIAMRFAGVIGGSGKGNGYSLMIMANDDKFMHSDAPVTCVVTIYYEGEQMAPKIAAVLDELQSGLADRFKQ